MNTSEHWFHLKHFVRLCLRSGLESVYLLFGDSVFAEEEMYINDSIPPDRMNQKLMVAVEDLVQVQWLE